MSSENINNANHRRKPKKLIHCSDGVVEESSDDEVDQAPEIRNTDSSVNAVKYFKASVLSTNIDFFFIILERFALGTVF